MNYYVYCFQHYADFNGRARRSEYWYFVLFNVIVGFCIGFVSALVGISWLGYVYDVAVFVPSLAVAIRRMHDIGKSGWWILISLIPLIGWIWYLILCCKDSQPGANEYGPNPKDGLSTPPPFQG